MKFVLRQIFAAVTLTASSLCAGDFQELKIADAALAAGDFPNAVSSYKDAMLAADEKKDAETWAQSALKLCRTYLRSGDFTKAREVLNEFRRRNPMRSAGTLPGDLLACEGKYAEAEQAFAALAASDPGAIPAVNFSRGSMKLRAGDLNGAYELFSRLAQGDSSWAAEAQSEAVYILIRTGRAAEAVKFLQSLPADSNRELLLYLAEAYDGKTANFKQNFTKFIENQSATPHIRLLELLSTAAKAAEKSGDMDFAVSCLTSALAFPLKKADEQDFYRQLINIYAAVYSEKAIPTAQLYVKNFPTAADRATILNSVGRKLITRPDMAPQAVKLFAETALNNSLPLQDRLEAASDAVSGNSKLKSDAIDPAPVFTFLCHNVQAAEKNLWHCRFAEFLEKKGDTAGALKEYQAALHTAPPAKKERIHLELMNFFLRTGDEKNMAAEAELLSKSANKQYFAEAKFQLAQAAEKRGDIDAARQLYLESARIKDSKNQENAQFSAAWMAYKNSMDEEAAKEFFDFAVEHEKSALTPHALYLALESLNGSDNTELSEKAAALFKTKYSDSDAWAYYVLNHAGKDGDITGAIKILEELEKVFSNSAVGVEITLKKAVFMDRSGDADKALSIYISLISNNKSATVAAESAWHAGEILFRRNEFYRAREMFLLGAKLEADDLLADTASLRAVDCDLIRSASLSQEMLADSTKRCERIAGDTKYEHIRQQALYKLGECHKLAGNYEAAIRAFEKLLHLAHKNFQDQLIPNQVWCIRGTETALDLLAMHRVPGALQRGTRMIRQLEAIDLKQDGMLEKFRTQLNQTRRK